MAVSAPVRRPPGRPRATFPRPLPARPPAPFDVGGREVLLRLEQGRWSVSVDGVRLPRWFITQVDAWTAGVGHADRLGPPG